MCETKYSEHHENSELILQEVKKIWTSLPACQLTEPYYLPTFQNS